MLSHEFIASLVPVCLAMVTYGIGINITISQAKHVLFPPKVFLVALTSQMVALPLIAFAIAEVIPASPEIKVGLVVLAASPGGSTSGFLTYLFKGNTALSIILTSVNSLLTLFTIPLIVNIALERYMNTDAHITLPFVHTMIEIFVVTLIPASLGVLTRIYFGNFAHKLAKVIKPILMVLLGIVFSLMIFSGGDNGHPGITAQDFKNILPYCLMLNLSCMVVGYFLPGFFKLGYRNQITTSIESGVHNTTLAFLITFTILQNFELAKPALVYAVMSFWTAVLFIYTISRLVKDKGEELV